MYRNYIVEDISWGVGNEYVDFSNGTRIYLNEALGDFDEDAVKRFQIRQTIEEHFGIFTFNRIIVLIILSIVCNFIYKE